MTETEHLVRSGTDIPNELANNMRTNDGAIEGARGAQTAMRNRLGELRHDVSGHRSTLAAGTSGATTDRATATTIDLEKEVEDILTESAKIEDAVAEAAEKLKVGQIENDRLREEIIKDISKTMKLVASLRAQPDGKGNAAAQQALLDLMDRIAKKTGETADNARKTISALTGIADGLNGGGSTHTSSAGGKDTKVASSFNAGVQPRRALRVGWHLARSRSRLQWTDHDLLRRGGARTTA